MKKRILACCKVVLLLALLYGCGSYVWHSFLGSMSGAADWIYDDLPNGYIVSRSNGSTIDVGRATLFRDSGSIIGTTTDIDAYVSYISCIDSYLFAQQVPRPEDSNHIDLSNPDYWIVDTEEEAVYGPYSETELQAACVSFGLPSASSIEWIRTTDLPKIMGE